MTQKVTSYETRQGLNSRIEHISEEYDLSKGEVTRVLAALGSENGIDFEAQPQGINPVAALLNASMVSVVISVFLGVFTFALEYNWFQETLYSFAIAFVFLLSYATVQKLADYTGDGQ